MNPSPPSPTARRDTEDPSKAHHSAGHYPNDGGTARDKAARFTNLRAEGMRLGGVPVFAVLGGLGWLRVNDTLGPVVAACDGRVFTLGTLTEMLGVAPISGLVNTP